MVLRVISVAFLIAACFILLFDNPVMLITLLYKLSIKLVSIWISSRCLCLFEQLGFVVN